MFNAVIICILQSQAAQRQLFSAPLQGQTTNILNDSLNLHMADRSSSSGFNHPDTGKLGLDAPLDSFASSKQRHVPANITGTSADPLSANGRHPKLCTDHSALVCQKGYQGFMHLA